MLPTTERKSLISQSDLVSQTVIKAANYIEWLEVKLQSFEDAEHGNSLQTLQPQPFQSKGVDHAPVASEPRVSIAPTEAAELFQYGDGAPKLQPTREISDQNSAAALSEQEVVLVPAEANSAAFEEQLSRLSTQLKESKESEAKALRVMREAEAARAVSVSRLAVREHQEASSSARVAELEAELRSIRERLVYTETLRVEAVEFAEMQRAGEAKLHHATMDGIPSDRASRETPLAVSLQCCSALAGISREAHAKLIELREDLTMARLDATRAAKASAFAAETLRAQSDFAAYSDAIADALRTKCDSVDVDAHRRDSFLRQRMESEERTLSRAEEKEELDTQAQAFVEAVHAKSRECDNLEESLSCLEDLRRIYLERAYALSNNLSAVAMASFASEVEAALGALEKCGNKYSDWIAERVRGVLAQCGGSSGSVPKVSSLSGPSQASLNGLRREALRRGDGEGSKARDDALVMLDTRNRSILLARQQYSSQLRDRIVSSISQLTAVASSSVENAAVSERVPSLSSLDVLDSDPRSTAPTLSSKSPPFSADNKSSLRTQARTVGGTFKREITVDDKDSESAMSEKIWMSSTGGAFDDLEKTLWGLDDVGRRAHEEIMQSSEKCVLARLNVAEEALVRAEELHDELEAALIEQSLANRTTTTGRETSSELFVEHRRQSQAGELKKMAQESERELSVAKLKRAELEKLLSRKTEELSVVSIKSRGKINALSIDLAAAKRTHGVLSEEHDRCAARVADLEKALATSRESAITAATTFKTQAEMLHNALSTSESELHKLRLEIKQKRRDAAENVEVDAKMHALHMRISELEDIAEQRKNQNQKLSGMLARQFDDSVRSTSSSTSGTAYNSSASVELGNEAASAKPPPPPGLASAASQAVGAVVAGRYAPSLSCDLGSKGNRKEEKKRKTELRHDSSSIPTSLAALRIVELEGTIEELRLQLRIAAEDKKRSLTAEDRHSAELALARAEREDGAEKVRGLRDHLSLVQQDCAGAHERLATQAKYFEVHVAALEKLHSEEVKVLHAEIRAASEAQENAEDALRTNFDAATLAQNQPPPVHSDSIVSTGVKLKEDAGTMATKNGLHELLDRTKVERLRREKELSALVSKMRKDKMAVLADLQGCSTQDKSASAKVCESDKVELCKVRDALYNAERANSAAKSQIAGLESDLKTSKSQVELEQGKVLKFAGMLEAARCTVNELQEAATEADTKMQTILNARLAAEHANSDIQTKLQAAKAKIEHIESLLTKTAASRDAAVSKCAKLTAAIEAKADRLKSTHAELQLSGRARARSRALASELQQKIHHDFEDRLARELNVSQQLKNNLTALTEERDSLRSRLSTAEELAGSSEARLGALRVEIRSIRRERSRAVDNLEKKEAENQITLAKLQEAENSATLLENAAGAHEAKTRKLEELQHKVHELSKAEVSFKSQVSIAVLELSKRDRALDLSIAELDKTAKQLSSSREENAVLSAKCEGLQSHIDELHHAITQKAAECKDTSITQTPLAFDLVNEKKGALDLSIRHVNEQLTHAETDHKAARRKSQTLHSTMKEYGAKMSKLLRAAKAQELKVRAMDLGDKAGSASCSSETHVLNKLRSDIEETQAKLDAVKAKMTKTRHDESTAKSVVEHLERKKSTLTENMAVTNRHRDSLTEGGGNTTRDEGLESQVVELRTEVGKLSTALAEAHATIAKNATELARGRNAQNALEKELNRREKAMEGARKAVERAEKAEATVLVLGDLHAEEVARLKAKFEHKITTARRAAEKEMCEMRELQARLAAHPPPPPIDDTLNLESPSSEANLPQLDSSRTLSTTEREADGSRIMPPPPPPPLPSQPQVGEASDIKKGGRRGQQSTASNAIAKTLAAVIGSPRSPQLQPPPPPPPPLPPPSQSSREISALLSLSHESPASPAGVDSPVVSTSPGSRNTIVKGTNRISKSSTASTQIHASHATEGVAQERGLEVLGVARSRDRKKGEATALPTFRRRAEEDEKLQELPFGMKPVHPSHSSEQNSTAKKMTKSELERSASAARFSDDDDDDDDEFGDSDDGLPAWPRKLSQHPPR